MMTQQFEQGWVNDPMAVAAVMATMPAPTFAEAAPHLLGAGGEDEVYLWKAAVKATGKILPARNQGAVGSCVSFGTASAIEHLSCVQAANTGTEEFKPLAQEVIYAGSRVEVGGGRLRGGDGSVGAWAADFVRKWGVVPRGVIGKYDLSTYNESRCRQWGDSGVPDDLEPEARKHPVKQTAQVRGFAELQASIRNGYPIAVCSNVGFDKQVRDQDGFCKPRGQWMHCVMPDAMIAGPVMRRAADVEVGHVVYGHDGLPHPVTEVHRRRHMGTLVNIKAAGLPSAAVTDEHPVLVYRRVRGKVRQAVCVGAIGGVETPGDTHRKNWERFQPGWVRAKDVRPGDFIVAPRLAADMDMEIPSWSETARSQGQVPPITPDAGFAWLCGLYAGDGHATVSHKIGLTLGTGKPIVRAEQELARFGVTVGKEEHDTYVRLAAYSAVLGATFAEWFGGGSRGPKRLPEWLMSWRPFYADVLQGLLDSDGCRYHGRCIVTTTSQGMAHQIRLIAATLGLKPTMYVERNRDGGYDNAQPLWTIEWRPGTSKPRVRETADGAFVLHPVRSVVLSHCNGEVFNYEVEDAHTYVADGLIVHNCMAFIGITGGRRPGAFILNSWGLSPTMLPESQTGPIGIGDHPPAGFWADADVVDSMLRQGDSWAFSSFAGFPAQVLNWLI